MDSKKKRNSCFSQPCLLNVHIKCTITGNRREIRLFAELKVKWENKNRMTDDNCMGSVIFLFQLLTTKKLNFVCCYQSFLFFSLSFILFLFTFCLFSNQLYCMLQLVVSRFLSRRVCSSPFGCVIKRQSCINYRNQL